MVTIAEDIQNKSEKINKWIKENPGIPLVYGPSKDELIFFERDLKDSPAFRTLSRGAMLIYLDFLGKRKMEKDRISKRWFIQNNGKIVYPYPKNKEAEYNGTQFRDWIDELIDHGLIGISHHGKGGRKPENGSGDVSLYFISKDWCRFGEDGFKPQKRKKDTRQGRGFALVWSDPKKKAAMQKKRAETIRRKRAEKQNIGIVFNIR